MSEEKARGDRSSVVDSLLDHISTLVSYPTVSETPNDELQHWLAGRLEERGASVQILESGPLRSNLIARVGPDMPGGVLFAGHTDVVPAGHGWDHDPWQVEVREGRISGRGTADMKGFLACLLVALDIVDVDRLRRPMHILASCDEEVGCVGIRNVLPVLADANRVRPELVVVGEPTSMRPRFSHLGKQVLRVTVTTPPAHSSRAASSPNAIAHAATLITALTDIQRTCPPAAGDAIAYSVNVGTIRGGTQTNVIAPKCEFVFEVRFAAGRSPDEVLQPFHDRVADVRVHLASHSGDVTVESLTSYPAMCTDTTLAAFREAVTIADSGPAGELGYGTEGGLIAEALNVPVMICGPGDIAVAHRPNEFVPLAELERCVRFIAHLVESTSARRPS
jgi:acetylornithine deacetylase